MLDVRHGQSYFSRSGAKGKVQFMFESCRFKEMVNGRRRARLAVFFVSNYRAILYLTTSTSMVFVKERRRSVNLSSWLSVSTFIEHVTVMIPTASIGPKERHLLH